MAGLSLLLPGGSLLAYGHFIGRFRFEHTLFSVPWPLPGPPLRVMHLSDLHLSRWDSYARRLLGEATRPGAVDLLVVTGDLVSPGFHAGEVEEILGRLPRPPGGVVAVPGNWEYWSGMDGEGFDALCERLGWISLRNRHIRISLPGRSLTVVGVDDLLGGRPDHLAARKGLPRGEPCLVLAHCPAAFPDVAEDGDLVLSGHAHGGQVRLPGWGAPWLPAGCRHYDQGWFTRPGGRRLFVHRGCGCAILPFRWNCRPEIAVLELGG